MSVWLEVGVFKKIRNRKLEPNSDTRIEFSGTRTEVFIFLVRVPEPIILSGYRFGYGSGSLPKRVPDNPIFFKIFWFFSEITKSVAQCPNLLWAELWPLGSPSSTASTDQL